MAGNLFPRLRFGLVWQVSFLAACGIEGQQTEVRSEGADYDKSSSGGKTFGLVRRYSYAIKLSPYLANLRNLRGLIL